MAVPYFRSVFITGSNRGIGLEFVKQFLGLSNAPEFVFATCRSLQSESANELQKLASKHSNLILLQLDVDDYEQLSKVASEVTAKLQGKGLNFLLNNAAIMNRQVIGEITPGEMARLYKTNTISPIMVTQALLPLLKLAAKDPNDKSSPKAAIGYLSTDYVSSYYRQKRRPYPYTASKGALTALVRPMQDDLEDDGIVVAALDPGWVQTDMGGPKGHFTPQESVSGLMKSIATISEDARKGMLGVKEMTPW
ncbi:uncharacterized protein LOC110236516 [Exaiptasia diaphana]|uniref:Uncharacterized protein n=1 Tax=Exaiptasia diaphana TaxID=2652724 RepID=A0A913X231_EXADI|nr:uncharacterized protein LOC110236516 [Exaiptasia diaphana]